MIWLRVLLCLIGIVVVCYALQTAIRTFMLPQPGLTLISRIVFQSMHYLMRLLDRPRLSQRRRQEWLSVYAPLCLVLMVIAAITLIGIGYTLILYSLGIPSFEEAFVASLSSVSTLGFASLGSSLAIILVATVEALTGILIVALLVGYLPTVYAAFQQHEQAVDTLELHVGQPASAVAILRRYSRPPNLDQLDKLWQEWTDWFDALGGSQRTLAGILFVRTPRPYRSWVTTACAVLDAAALATAALDRPADPAAEHCLETGSTALGMVRTTFHLLPDFRRLDHDASFRVTREQFDQACASLAEQGLAVKPDREAAWQEFSRRRGGYHDVLLDLARLTLAPTGPWLAARPAPGAPASSASG